MDSNVNRRSLGVRVAVLAGVAVGLTSMPARGAGDCEACVWEWNGAGYTADCEAATSGGYDGCIPATSETCWVGDDCT